MKLFLFPLLFAITSSLYAMECDKEPRVCELDKVYQDIKTSKSFKPLALDLEQYADLKSSVRKKIQGYFTITDVEKTQHAIGTKSLQLATPAVDLFETILSSAQSAYNNGDRKLAYRIIRYSKPKSKRFVEVVDQLLVDSPYTDRFNCYLAKEFNIRNFAPKDSKVCDLSLLDVYVGIGGEADLSNKNNTLTFLDKKNRTCLYFSNQKKCYKSKVFARYKPSISLLIETKGYQKKKGVGQLVLVPDVKK